MPTTKDADNTHDKFFSFFSNYAHPLLFILSEIYISKYILETIVQDLKKSDDETKIIGSIVSRSYLESIIVLWMTIRHWVVRSVFVRLSVGLFEMFFNFYRLADPRYRFFCHIMFRIWTPKYHSQFVFRINLTKYPISTIKIPRNYYSLKTFNFSDKNSFKIKIHEDKSFRYA